MTQVEKESLFSDPTIRTIYDLGHSRDSLGVLKYAQSDRPIDRTAVAKAFSSIQPVNCPEELHELLMDPIPYVRLYASHAVGQIGDENSLPFLEKAFKKATIPEIKAELLEAIGKCADQNAMDFLIRHNPSTAIEESGKVWGIYRAMLKGLLRQEHIEIVVAHLKSSENETRLAAANVLSRQRSFPLTNYTDVVFEHFESESDPHISLRLLNVLRETSEGQNAGLTVLETSSNALLRSSALMNIKDPENHIPLLESSVMSGSPWEAMTASKVLSTLESYSPSQEVVSYAYTSEVPEVVSLIAERLLNTDWEQGRTFYLNNLERFSNPVKQSYLVGIWSQFPVGIDSLSNYLFIDGPIGTSAAMAVVSGIQKYPEWEEKFSQMASEVFKKKLFSQSIVFSNYIREEGDEASFYKESLMEILEHFNSPEKVEGYLEIAKTLNEIYEYKTEEIELTHPPINWEHVQTLNTESKMILYVKGDEYPVSLVLEDAPASVSYIANLAKERFYDGTYFHRIVPTFVSQGGGPRGDGFGSTDNLLRSEFAPIKYGPGVVGLATAGKDTESCQFFFTHTSTPHLDGRYTIIGASEAQLFDIESGAVIDSVRID